MEINAGEIKTPEMDIVWGAGDPGIGAHRHWQRVSKQNL